MSTQRNDANPDSDDRDRDLIYDWNVSGPPAPELSREVEMNDETLRDGLQSPSVTDPPIEKKLEILHLMENLGIHAMNAGLPGAGPRAIADVTRIVEEIRDQGMKIYPNCAGRTHEADIIPIAEISQKTGVEIEAATFIGSSPIRQYTESWTVERMLKHTINASKLCEKYELPQMYVTEDTTRAHPDTLRQLYLAAIEHGARRIVVCDTVGHSTPDGVRNLIRFIKNLVDESGEPVKIDWHGHRDRGLDLVNSIVAIEEGAHRIHGSAIGIGERCGNTAIDLLLVNLKLLGVIDNDLTRLSEYLQLVSESCEVPIPKNYPVFGQDAFETATGVHAAAVIKAIKKNDPWLANRVYSGVPADVFGLEQIISVGPMSGRSNVIYWLEKRGIPAAEATVDRVFHEAKQSKRTLTEAEIRSLVTS